MGRYTNEQLIGRGRYSEVYRATDTLDEGVTIAIKVTCPDEERRPHNSRDELKILRSLASLKKMSPNVIRLLDSFERDITDIAMVFPYYPLTLHQLLRHHAESQGAKFNPYAQLMSRDSSTESSSNFGSQPPKLWKSKLSISAGRSILKGLASGLAFLHEHGIIHRDIKPQNVMFKSYDCSCPVIIDLGISYQLPDNFGKEKPENKICDIATGIYRAPELVFGIRDYGFGVDIWALGIMMTLIFSENVKPALDEADLVDLKLMSEIFTAFGTPTLESWPEAAKSSTFSNLQLAKSEPKLVSDLLPRCDQTIRDIFKKMMVYESSQRLSAREIVSLLD